MIILVTITALIVLVIIAAALSTLQNKEVHVAEYEIGADDAGFIPINIVLISDLHRAQFGEHNQQLVDKTAEQHPDLIMIAGDMLEMLFVAPGMRGKGFGRQLVNHITRHCGVRRVDVNEQNPQAAGFYERMGFRTAGRDATDPSGRPYPILHMELGHAPHTGLVPIPSLLIDRIDIDFRAEVPGTDTEKQP